MRHSKEYPKLAEKSIVDRLMNVRESTISADAHVEYRKREMEKLAKGTVSTSIYKGIQDKLDDEKYMHRLTMAVSERHLKASGEEIASQKRIIEALSETLANTMDENKKLKMANRESIRHYL